MHKLFLQAAAILGFLSVAIGAFGAHALKAFLETNNRLETFETAVKYQFYHALALLLVAILLKDYSSKHLVYSGYSFILGSLIFSGSLYLLCFTGVKFLGAITPIGGLLFLVGWFFIFWFAFKNL